MMLIIQIPGAPTDWEVIRIGFKTTTLVLSNYSIVNTMYELVLSGVKEIKGHRVAKRRKSEAKKFEEVDRQKDWWWEVTYGPWPLVQGHREGHTEVGALILPSDHHWDADIACELKRAWLQRANGHGLWLPGGSVLEATGRCHMWRRGDGMLPLRAFQPRQCSA